MSWSPQQEAALKAVAAWLRDPRGPQVYRLFGFAGTGKTTLAKEMAKSVRGKVHYACFTGKAALVLRKKGCHGASTIHGLIYKPIDLGSGRTVFQLNPESPAADAGLLIIDEVSMVDEQLGTDLLSYGTRVLVLGDPEQLPPVKGEGFFINARPDVMLTEVHRQAADNPIIRMSMDVREGKGLQLGTYGDSRVIRRNSIAKDEMRELVVSADQLLCGMNKTRQTFNARIRAIHGRQGLQADFHPVAGERLVCLKNNKEKGLLNGGLWETVEVIYAAGMMEMVVKSIDEPQLAHVDVTVPEQFFSGNEKELEWSLLKRVDQFTYGSALTVHKSQGSQFDNLVLFDESSVFRADARKHLYTGITRAAERVTVVV